MLEALMRAEQKAEWIEKRKGPGYVDSEYFWQLVAEELRLMRLRERGA